MQYLVQGGAGQRVHIRKRGHEAVEIRNDGSHLGLLQHHFRNPDLVRCRILLPGQVCAAMILKPGEYPARKLSLRHCEFLYFRLIHSAMISRYFLEINIMAKPITLFMLVLLTLSALPAFAGTAADEVDVLDPWAREVPP